MSTLTLNGDDTKYFRKKCLKVLNAIDDFYKKHDMLLSTDNLLQYVLQQVQEMYGVLPEIPEESEVEVAPVPKIIISCDASCKKNPGGPSAVGVVITFPDGETPKRDPLKLAHVTQSITNNQAEFDAVYSGLTTLVNLINSPKYPIEVHSDSLLVIDSLNGKKEVKDTKLATKLQFIKELVAEIPQEIKFIWKPRNSTPQLKEANYLAQDRLGVPRH